MKKILSDKNTFQMWKKQIRCVSILQVFYIWYCLMYVTHSKLHNSGQWGVRAVTPSWWIAFINSSKPADWLHQLKSQKLREVCFIVMNTETNLKLGYLFDSIHTRMGVNYHYASTNKMLLSSFAPTCIFLEAHPLQLSPNKSKGYFYKCSGVQAS